MITHLYIHNFRCFESFNLQLDKAPSSLLIGRNGTGKSTIGTVLEIFQKIARGENLLNQLVRVADFYQARTDEPMGFAMEVELSGKRYIYTLHIELQAGEKDFSIRTESLYVDGIPYYERKGAEIYLYKKGDVEAVHFSIDVHSAALPILQASSRNDPLQTFRDWLINMIVILPLCFL